jgi:hypothetical protein
MHQHEDGVARIALPENYLILAEILIFRLHRRSPSTTAWSQ